MYGRYLMNCLQNDSFKDLKNAVANLGDSVQALAVDYIYKQLNIDEKDIEYIKRDFINECRDNVDLILYTEFYEGNVKERLTIPNNVHIKGIISAVFYDEISLLNKKIPHIYSFLKQNEPIGARDEHTKNYLNSIGIESYLTGCFTICFPLRKNKPKQTKVFFVDTPLELEQYIPDEIRHNSEYITHSVPYFKYPIDIKESNRIEEIAKNILKRYRDEATLVVTGRLHVALPCLAMGIPVILTCNNIDFRFSWVEKFLTPYQLGEYDNIDWNPNPVYFENLKKDMLDLHKKLLLGNKQEAKNIFLKIDHYYMDRNRIKPYKFFREKIMQILKNKKGRFRYMIWGAGCHCRYAYEIIQDIYPQAELVCVVDKFKKGTFKNIPIVSSEFIANKDIDYIFITTVPGTQDALNWISMQKLKLEYAFITSQHKS